MAEMKNRKQPHRWPKRDLRFIKDHAREMEDTMQVFLTLEASQPNGATYRLALGCILPPGLLSMVAVLSRLF